MASGERPRTHYFDQFQLDPVRGTVLGPNRTELRLRPKTFSLLRHLLDNPGRILGRDELLDALWPGVVVTDDSLTQCVSDLRHAFGERAAHVLRTVPKRGYMLIAEVRRDDPPVTKSLPPAIPVAAHDLAALREAPVAIHPFETLDEDRACIFLANALATDLVAEFARVEGLRILPSSDATTPEGFRVTGEVRAAGAGLRVTVRLEDAATGTALWAEQLDQPRDGPQEPSRASLLALAAHLDWQVARHSLLMARRKPIDALSARELCLIGRDHHLRVTEADTEVAREMFARAMTTDPGYAEAYAWQAYTVHRAVTHGWGSPRGQDARDEALRLARRAVQLQPDSPLCLSRLAFALVLDRRWEEAVDVARSALTSSRPAFAATRITCAEVLVGAGHPEEAAEIAQGTLALDPLAPPTAKGILGRALLLAGRVEEALPALRWCALHLPDYAATYDTLVVAAMESGRVADALVAWRELLRLKPDWAPRNHTGFWYFHRDDDLRRFQAAHRRAAELEAADGIAGAGPSDKAPPPEAASAARPWKAAEPADPRDLARLRRDALVLHPLHSAPDDNPATRAALLLISELAAELARYENLRVVTDADDGAEQKFGVRGNVYSAGESLHVIIHLFDSATGTLVWAKRLEWPSEHTTHLPDGSVEALASALDIQIGRETLRRARQKPVDKMTARELAYFGKDLFQHGNRADTEAAQALFIRSAALDPEYAPAHAWHALALARAAVHGWEALEASELAERAIRLARCAIGLEPESPFSLAVLALTLGLGGRWEEAVSAARLALGGERVAGEGARISVAEVLTAAGHPEEADDVLRGTLARNRHGYPLAHAVLGRALLLRGRAEEAMDELRQCAAQVPDYALCFRTMVVAAIEAGLIEDAREALRQVARLRPEWVRGTAPIFWFLRREQDRERCQRAFDMAMRLDITARMGGLMEAPSSEV